MLKELEPYDIMRCVWPDYAHACELSSRPTPEGTIMARMVIGDPYTRQEVKVAQLKLLGWKPRWIYYAIVTPFDQQHSIFPVDMLRYDFCAPVTFTLEDDEYGLKPVLKPEQRLLVVAKAAEHSSSKRSQFSTDRWSSFGWSVTLTGSVSYKKETVIFLQSLYELPDCCRCSNY